MFAQPFLKIVTFKDLFYSHPGTELHKICGGELVHPFAVEAKLGLFGIEQLEHLLFVSFGVYIYLLARERRPRHVLARRVADHPCKIADQENDRMPKFLKRLQLSDHDRVTDMNIRSGRVKAELYTQRLPGLRGPLQFLTKVLIADHIDRAFFEI